MIFEERAWPRNGYLDDPSSAMQRSHIASEITKACIRREGIASDMASLPGQRAIALEENVLAGGKFAREVKDAIAYLQAIVNPADDVAS